jgi:argininosuccinate lyase
MSGYTHMVQAQPTTLAHQLSAFAAAMERDAERWREVYARLDASPLGVGAFTTSGYGLNRERLRELVEGDYAVMTELAETREREGRVAFRVGHPVAAALTKYGREKGKRPLDLTYEEFAAVYREVTGQAVTVGEAAFRALGR